MQHCRTSKDRYFKVLCIILHYWTFATHKHGKHIPNTSQDFKPGIICDITLPEEALDFEASEEDDDHSGAIYEGALMHTMKRNMEAMSL